MFKALKKFDGVILRAFLASILISTVVVLFWFSKVPQDEFLLMHDQLLHFSREAISTAFYIRSAGNIGIANGLSSILSSWHLLIYGFLYSLGLGIRSTEAVSFALYLFLTLFLSFLGFWNLKKFSGWKVGDMATYALALFYTFNAYTLIMWHTGNYSANFALTYAFFPLTAFYLAKIIENKSTLTDLILLAITFFFMSFYITAFGVAIIFFAFGILIGFIARPKNIKGMLKSLVILGVLYIPLAAYVIVTIFYELMNISGAVNQNPSNIYTMLNGGILYPLLMRFSWAIYINWAGKSIFTYDKFFFNNLVNLSFFSTFFILGYLILKKRIDSLISYSAFLFLLASIFLAKGAQYPFGYVFLFLYKNMPLFNIFRSPDSKFGMGIILSLSLLFLYFSQYIKPKVFLTGMILILFIQAHPLINGSAIIGNSRDGVDRSIKLTETYKNLSEHIVSSGTDNVTVLVLPPNVFGYFDTSDGFSFIGPDPLRKMSNANLIYPNESFSIYRQTFENIKNSLVGGDMEVLRQLGISHILLRRDSSTSKTYKFPDTAIFSGYTDLIYEDESFSLYKFKNVEPIIQGRGVSYVQVSPVKYYVHVEDYTPGYEVRFLNSYHDGWEMYRAENPPKSWIGDIKYLFMNPVRTHVPTPQRYFNSWKIDEAYPSDLDLVLYFKPQSYSYLALAVSLAVLTVYVSYVSYVSISRGKGK